MGTKWRGLMARWRLENPVRQGILDWAVPHLHADKPGRTTGEPDRPCNAGFQYRGNKASKPLTEKTCEGCSSRINCQPQRRVGWRDPQGPRTYTDPPTWESAPEGPNLLVGSGGSD